ncbi:hypothetical protein ILUMI_03168 [Ignelater luminosus]|uniref:Uncharacterized protein n=1 Tax=Ignelater luminosus TaxID=2038154 RepID=A0A8K0GK62_IGNLU|nr:hypothetical protein ILUMI_03168 [Ignelater luminosus]
MPVNNNELISVAQQLSEDQNLRVTIKESMKGACMAGGGALVGGLLGGPIGLAIGGTVGSVCAAWKGSGKYKSVALVIMEDMSANQREQLASSLRRAVEGIQVEDAVMLTGLVMGNAAVQRMFLTELCNFLRTEMGLAITV